MRFLGTLLLFGGYVLIYAAIAKGGRFATDPWNGVFTDAYSVTASNQGPVPSDQVLGRALQAPTTAIGTGIVRGTQTIPRTFARPRRTTTP